MYIRNLYEKRLDLAGQIKIDDFPQLEEDLFELIKVSMSEIQKPQELIKSEILQQFNKEQYYYILKDIYRYADENKIHYNRIINDKRGKLIDKLLGTILY